MFICYMNHCLKLFTQKVDSVTAQWHNIPVQDWRLEFLTSRRKQLYLPCHKSHLELVCSLATGATFFFFTCIAVLISSILGKSSNISSSSLLAHICYTFHIFLISDDFFPHKVRHKRALVLLRERENNFFFFWEWRT